MLNLKKSTIEKNISQNLKRHILIAHIRKFEAMIDQAHIELTKYFYFKSSSKNNTSRQTVNKNIYKNILFGLKIKNLIINKFKI